MKKTDSADIIWALLRLNPPKLGEFVVPEVVKKLSIPSWSRFNTILFPDIPMSSTISYCPMTDGSSSNYSTIYTACTENKPWAKHTQ